MLAQSDQTECDSFDKDVKELADSGFEFNPAIPIRQQFEENPTLMKHLQSYREWRDKEEKTWLEDEIRIWNEDPRRHDPAVKAHAEQMKQELFNHFEAAKRK